MYFWNILMEANLSNANGHKQVFPIVVLQALAHSFPN